MRDQRALDIVVNKLKLYGHDYTKLEEIIDAYEAAKIPCTCSKAQLDCKVHGR